MLRITSLSKLTCCCYSNTILENKFTHLVRQNLETHWRKKFEDRAYYQEWLNNQDYSHTDKNCYVLSMFPYPSGALHMGHVRVYTISDMMARYKRMYEKKKIIHPMGWDAFGLPAENAARERNLNPEIWTKKNIASMKNQIMDLGCFFDWEREISTCDSRYYKWTQFLFLKMFEHGLVYQKMGSVHWDPVDKTVLADEQVNAEGKSWRSGAKVERRFFKQWYIKVTAFSKSLLDELDKVDSTLWKDVVDLQKNWIGNCDGMQFHFHIQNMNEFITIFTRQPKHIQSASHIFLSKNHFFNNSELYKNPSSHNKNVIELTIRACNPFNNQTIPIYLNDDFDFGLFQDTYIGLPSHSQDDLNFALENNLPIPTNIDLAEEEILLKHGHVTSEKARDWLISRQRYWGTPIPVVHCAKYGATPVAYKTLPVALPNMDQFTTSADGRSPLTNCTEWLKAKCYKCDCDSYGERESDTMDTFVDSSWYFLRYLDPTNQNAPFEFELANQSMPVDLYIGGKEHATMHLYYARFVYHFLHSIGYLKTKEPFLNLLTQGMVLGKSYQDAKTGIYLKPEDIDLSDPKIPVRKGTSTPVVVQWEKMSKSKHNGVDPLTVLNKYGSDSTRLAILSNVAPKSDRLWSDEIFVGTLRWQSRVWSLVYDFVTTEITHDAKLDKDNEASLCDVRNSNILQINYHLNKTFLFNTAISRMQILTNILKKVSPAQMRSSPEFERSLADLVIILFPFAPYFSSHLWQAMSKCNIGHVNTTYKWTEPVFKQNWPSADLDYHLALNVKIDQKNAFSVRLPMSHQQTESQLTPDLAWQLVASDDGQLQALLGGRTVAEQQLVVHGNAKAEYLIKTVGGGKKKM